jgi:hypothetical protein
MKLNIDKSTIVVAIFCLLLIWPVASRSQTNTPGDITGDGKVDLQDSIAAFQILVGISPSTPVNLSGDVNGDNRIGLEEAIHALQVVAGRYNHPPELDPIGNKIADENSELSFSISGFDTDGDALTYSAYDLPDGAIFNPSTRTFSWTPTDSQSGLYDVTFTVTDIYDASDSETIKITVRPLVVASEYFPLNVGDWWDYRNNDTGQVYRTTVSGTKLIHGTETKILSYGDGTKEYYTSDSNGIRLHGQYLYSTYYAGDVYFDTPLLLMPNNAQVGTTQISTTTFSLTVFVPGSGNVTVHVDVTSTTTVIGLEDVTMEYTTLVMRDCVKIYNEITMYINETGETVSEWRDYWLYQGVGVVKESSSGYIGTITCVPLSPSTSPPPTLLSVTPTAGAVDGGNLITLTGDGFQSGAGVIIGGKPATSSLVENSTTVTAFTPSGALGTADVAVVNPDCQMAVVENGFEFKKVFTATSTSGAPEGRYNHTAVWAGDEMIVWGGNTGNAWATDTGGRFDPINNTWSPTSTEGAPTARYLHTAVWTDTEMIVWGGRTLIAPGQFENLNSGAIYNPQTDTWTSISADGAPSTRYGHTAVWTGTEMIIWGGIIYTAQGTDTGARYNPATNTWTPISTTDAPSIRGRHSAVWTGTEMIVWGGEDDHDRTDTGGVYDPVSDSWRTIGLTDAPESRSGHAAVWTGSAMIVFGGTNVSPQRFLNSGGVYDTSLDSWAAISTVGAPPFSPYTHYYPAIWTGTELMTWGDVVGNGEHGARYNPVTDSWSPIMTPDARTGHTLVWTGSKMIAWGGDDSPSNSDPDTGWIYDPSVAPETFLALIPIISNVSPDNGPTSGDTDIVIAGENFRPHATVTIGGNPANNIYVVDANTIYATTPPGNPGYADVVVSLPAVPWWKVTASPGFAYTPFSFEGWIGGGLNGWQIGTAPSGGSSGNAEFSGPRGVFVDTNGYIFVADDNNNRIQKWDTNGNHIGWIGGGVNGWQTGDAPSFGTGNGQFHGTSKVDVDGEGNIYATDPYNHRVQKWDAAGNMVGWIGGGVNGWQTANAPSSGNGDGEFNLPEGVALDASGNIYIADKQNHRVHKWDKNGTYIGWIGGGVNGWQTGPAPESGSGDGSFKWPMDVAVDSNGNIYVADTWNWRIQKWSSTGNYVGWIGGGVNGWQTGPAPASEGTGFGEFREVFGVSVDTLGNIYAANTLADSVYKWDASGNAVGWIGNGQYGWQTGSVTGTYGSELGYFEFPWDMAVGPDGKLYIADTYNVRIVKWKE